MIQVRCIPRADGFVLRWKDKTIATDTTAMYTLSFNHDRNAVDSISLSFSCVFYINTYFAHSQRDPLHLMRHCRIVALRATDVHEILHDRSRCSFQFVRPQDLARMACDSILFHENRLDTKYVVERAIWFVENRCIGLLLLIWRTKVHS
jgi:hypothetical protein